MYDIVIIGGGPAGLSAAITARSHNKDVLVISNAIADNPLAASKLVNNYPGMPQATGLEILQAMHTQAQELGVLFLQARAISIVPIHCAFSVTTSSDYVETRSLIIACGASSGGKPIKGELELLGRGVSYCTTCDGMLYRSSTVLIAGLSAEAVEEANFMAELGATVHFISKKAVTGLDLRIQQYVGELTAIEGDDTAVSHVVLSEYAPDNSESNYSESSQKNASTVYGRKKDKNVNEVTLDVDGVFVLRPGVAPANMLSSLETEKGYIKVDAEMKTNIEGIFAAGDCTGRPLQIAKAVGQGQIAVLSAVICLLEGIGNCSCCSLY